MYFNTLNLFSGEEYSLKITRSVMEGTKENLKDWGFKIEGNQMSHKFCLSILK